MAPEDGARAQGPRAPRRVHSVLQTPASGRLVSVSRRAPGLHIGAVLQAARGQERFFWHSPTQEIAFAGFGAAVEMMAWGEGRIAEIEEKARRLFQDSIVPTDMEPTAAPRLFGGFAFRDDFTPDNTWAVFHPAHFILPHYQITQQGSEVWLTINAVVPPEENALSAIGDLRAAADARYDTLLALPPFEDATATYGPHALAYPMPYEIWQANIERAIKLMTESSLQKVVLARVAELQFEKRVQITAVLEHLNSHYPDAYRFLFEPRPYHAFYGATPELLVRSTGTAVTTMALAGSRARGGTPEEDAARAQELLASHKDRHEHALVVKAICRRLQTKMRTLQVADEPQLYTLSYIHHLHTPISGELRSPEGVLPLVELLHPTPALGGSPREQALAFIREAEPVPRGWYAAPIGWLDQHLDGEFAVAIRSAVVQRRRVWLYAGAGIVGDSDPRQEWQETGLKFRPMLQALGLGATG